MGRLIGVGIRVLNLPKDDAVIYDLQEAFLREFNSEGVYYPEDNHLRIYHQEHYASTATDKGIAQAAYDTVMAVGEELRKCTVVVEVHSLYNAPFTTHCFEADDVTQS